jgi:hypothetical protein
MTRTKFRNFCMNRERLWLETAGNSSQALLLKPQYIHKIYIATFIRLCLSLLSASLFFFRWVKFWLRIEIYVSVFELFFPFTDNNHSTLIAKPTREYIIIPVLLTSTNSVIFVGRQLVTFRCSHWTVLWISEMPSGNVKVSCGGFEKPWYTIPPNQPVQVLLLVATCVVAAKTRGCGRRICVTEDRSASRVTDWLYICKAHWISNVLPL